MPEFFKKPETMIDAKQIGNLLGNALEGIEPKTLKDAKAKSEWRHKVIKSSQGEAIAKKLNTRLAQDVNFMIGRNATKNNELAGVIKAFGEKATKDLKKEYDGLMDKGMKEAVEAIKKLGKSTK